MPPKRKKAKAAAAATTSKSTATDNPDPGDDANNNDSNKSSNIEVMSYPELLDRKQQMDERLAVVSIPDVPKKRHPKQQQRGGGARSSPTAAAAASIDSNTDLAAEIPFVPKTDTHWDFVMKGTFDFEIDCSCKSHGTSPQPCD